MKKIILTPSEAKIQEAIDRGEYQQTERSHEILAQARRMAREHIAQRKDKMVSFRISEQDLEKIKLKARKQGIPYQTLMRSWIYKMIQA